MFWRKIVINDSNKYHNVNLQLDYYIKNNRQGVLLVPFMKNHYI